MLRTEAALEAVLFASGEPLEKKRLMTLLGVSAAELETALAELTRALEGRGIALVETELEVELRTVTAASGLVKKLRESELARDLGKASLETLAVIAYQKGATRGEIDWVRGVNSATSVRNLLLRGLVEGREDPADKRRVRYNLTTEAFAHLGLTRAEELPRFSELAAGAQEVVHAEATG